MKRIQSFKGMGITRKENMVDKISIILNEPFFDNKTGEYILFNAYPTDLGQVDLSWDSQDTIQEYTVTITYDYWEFKSTTDTLDSVSKYGGVFT
jgi:hypothetical protein